MVDERVIDVELDQFIGHITDIRLNYARLTPLVHVRAGTYEHIEQPHLLFPNRGAVSWLDRLPPEAVKGSLWVFTPKEFPNFNSSDPKLDRFRINWDRLPRPPIDLISIDASSEDDALRILNRGLSLAFHPTPRVFIAIGGQRWVGPLTLEKRNDRWWLDNQERQTPYRVVDSSGENYLIQTFIDERRTFLRPDFKPVLIDECDWSPAEVAIKRAIRWVTSHDETFKAAHNFTNAALQAATEHLTSATLTEQRQIARAQSYLSEIAAFPIKVKEFRDELLSLPSVKQHIREAAEHARADAIAGEQQRLAMLRAEQTTLKTERDQLAQQNEALRRSAQHSYADEVAAIQAKIVGQQHELDAIAAQIADRRASLNAELDLADATIQAKIRDITAQPYTALADALIVRAMLDGGRIDPNLPLAAAVNATGAVPLLPEAMCAHGVLLSDAPKVKSAIQRAFRSQGFSSRFGWMIHSITVADGLPLIVGPDALDMAECYAAVIAAGRALTIPISPATIEPTDLLGHLDTQTGSWRLHAAGLLDLLTVASTLAAREQLFVVVLEGVNRAPVESYLLPLLACVRDSRRSIALAHPTQLPASSPYPARISWPRNVLLIGTVSEGRMSLPLVQEMWAHAALLIPERTKSDDTQANALTEVTRTEVSADIWTRWRGAVSDGAKSTQVPQSSFALPTTVARHYRSAAAAAQLFFDEPSSVHLATEAILVPFASSEGRLHELLESHGGHLASTIDQQRIERLTQ